jgi:hypothetical protein
MLRVTCPILILVAVAIAACTPEPPPPQPQPAPVAQEPADSPDADKEVLVATEPAGAKVILKGAEVGTTPMKLLVRGNTNVVLDKEGYVKQALMITPDSEPNLVITLVPSGEAPAETEAEGEASAAPASMAKKGKGKKGKEGEEAPAEPEAQPAETAAAEEKPAEPAPVAPPPEPKPKKKSYSNMRQLKQALAAGEITHAEAKQWQHKFKQMRAAEFEQAKQDYEDDKLTKAQYKQKIREIKLKYEG